MKTTATNRKVRTLLTGIRNESLTPRPEFQRKLVWRDKDKLNFLDTVLNGYPFPEIYIAAGEVNPVTGEGNEMLVDGQQRITTLYQYFTGSDELKLGKQLSPYAQLDRDQQVRFLEYEVVVRDLGTMSIEDIKEVFKRINATKYPLNAMEIRNSTYNGEFIRFAESLSQDRFFDSNKVFSATDIRRMQDVAFVLLLVITIMSTYFRADDEYERFLSEYNDEFNEKEQYSEEINKVMTFVEACNLGSNSRAWQKTNLFTLLVEVHRALIRDGLNLSAEVVGKHLKDFYQKLTNIADLNLSPEETRELNEYYKAYRSATDDRGSRIKRGEIIQKVIRTGIEPNVDTTRLEQSSTSLV